MMPRFRFRGLGLFADMEQSAKFVQIDKQLDEAQVAARRGVTDSCVTDVPNAPYAPVPAAAVLPQVAWPSALPAPEDVDWSSMSDRDKQDHANACPDMCALCEPHRSWGLCPACGSTMAEAIDGLTLCCRVRALFGDEAERAYV
jgi:hypothetical protein